MPVRTYVAATFLGILPGTFAYAYLGEGVDSVIVKSPKEYGGMKSEEYLKKIGAHEVVEFDLKNEKTWEAAVAGCTAVFSSSMDNLISEHMAFARFLGTKKESIKHVVRISCFGADTNTNSYNKESHVTRAGAEIPLMLQHYWWSEECLINAGLPVTSIRGDAPP